MSRKPSNDGGVVSCAS